MKENIASKRNSKPYLEEITPPPNQPLIQKKVIIMQRDKEEFEEEGSQLKIQKPQDPLSGRKILYEKGSSKSGQKESSQSQSPTPFGYQTSSALGYSKNSSSNNNQLVDIEYSSIEAERTIKKKINGDNVIQVNQNSPQQQWNELTMTKLYREGAQSPIDRNNLLNTQFLNRKQQILNNSFDSTQNAKKMNNFIHIDGINMSKMPQKKKLQVKRVRANQSLNGSPAGKRNHFGQQNQSQQSNLKDGNSTININDIISNNGGQSTTAFMATSYNSSANHDSQNNGFKSFQKLIEISSQKRRPSQEIQEFPQIVSTNKSSQSQFDRNLKSKASMQGRVTPKILQENLTNTNTIKSIGNITSINIRRKSTQLGNGIISKGDDSFTGVRRDTSHQSSKENGIRGITSDDSGDDLSFEGRYKQKQLFNIKQKLKLQKQNNCGAFKIYAEKEDLVLKSGIQGTQKLGQINENSSPTYNVQTTTTSVNSKQNGRQQFNQYLQQQPIVSQINTNKAHTKLKLEEIKNTYARHQTSATNNQLTSNLKQQIQQKVEKQQNNKNPSSNNQPNEKSRFSNLKINTRQEDVILEDENDGTLTINEDDIKLKGSELTHFNSPEKIRLDQSFQVVQNQHLEEDLENWKEERESLKKFSYSIQEENSKLPLIRGNGSNSIMGESMIQQHEFEQISNSMMQDSLQDHKKKSSKDQQKPVKILNNQVEDKNEMYESMGQFGSSSLNVEYVELKGQSEHKESKKKQQNQFYSLHQKSSNKKVVKNDKNNEQSNAEQNYSQKQVIEDEIQEDNIDDISVDMQSIEPSQISQILQINNSDDLPKQQQQEQDNEYNNSDLEKGSSVLSSLLVPSQNNSSFQKDFNLQQENQGESRQANRNNKSELMKSNSLIHKHDNVMNKELEQQGGNEESQINQQYKQEDSKDPYFSREAQIIEPISYNESSNASQKKLKSDNRVSGKMEKQQMKLLEDDILNKIDFQTIILWEQQISELSGCFKSQNATRCYNLVVNNCSQYLILIRSRDFDNFATLFADDKSRKIIRNQMNLEHLGIIVLLHNYLDRKNFMNNINTIRNIVSYIHLNFILLIDLIVSKVTQSHQQLMNYSECDTSQEQNKNQTYPESLLNIVAFVKDIAAQNIYRKKMNKFQDFLQAMKQNNEILLNLFRSSTKHDKDFYGHIQTISKQIEKSNHIQETFIYILNTFALYLTVLENIIGFQPLPFLAVCPAPYLPPIRAKQYKTEKDIKNVKEDANNSSENSNDNDTTTLETQPKEEMNNQQNQVSKQEKNNNAPSSQNQNKQMNKITQNQDQNPNRTQRSLSKQIGRGPNNNQIKRSSTPNPTAFNSKNGTNQIDTKKQNPQAQVHTAGPIRRKSSSFTNSNSANIIKGQKEEKINSQSQSHEYTLVLDLDETLVHYSETNSGGQFVVRPFAPEFLEILAQYYEIVVFTAAMPDYANWVLDNLDPNKYITYRLFRQHAVHIGNVFIKDLSRLGRPLEKTIIIDNVADNFQLQPENGIFIKGWFSDPNDTALTELLPLLKEMVNKKVPDVRKALKSFKEQMIQNIQNGVQNPHLNLKLN